jgi:hypothetical protein
MDNKIGKKIYVLEVHGSAEFISEKLKNILEWADEHVADYKNVWVILFDENGLKEDCVEWDNFVGLINMWQNIVGKRMCIPANLMIMMKQMK